MNFWNIDNFILNDDLNQEIWQNSPTLQREIQKPEELTDLGSIGAQQAMISSPTYSLKCLPWVPDLLGKDWQSDKALMIIGSVYAGFIKEYSTRSNCIRLADYVNSNLQEFQINFLENVVRNDSRYYEPVKCLIHDIVNPEKISLFDLCRVSFVKRGNVWSDGIRKDKSGDGIVLEAAKIFDKYISNPKATDWIWRRIINSRSKFIIALGTIAEHGLLRLFKSKLHEMELRVNHSSNKYELKSHNGGKWVKHYAKPGFSINYWISNQSWWIISGKIKEYTYSWRLLPVYHPSSQYFFINKRQATNLIKKMYECV